MKKVMTAKNKFYAFTLVEQLVVIIIIAVIAVIMMNSISSKDIQIDTLKKMSKPVFIQVEFAVKQMLMKNTNNFTFTRLVDKTGEFSIESNGALARFVAIFRKNLISTRKKELSNKYKTDILHDETTKYDGLNVSSFSGFYLKNSTYIGVNLNGNCTTTINYIYDPTTLNIRSKENTCGTIFIDVNGEKIPNILGVDQYVIALGKHGLK